MNHCHRSNPIPFAAFLQGRPQAVAKLCGSPDFPEICGSVSFYQTPRGVLVAAEVAGLPAAPLRGSDPCQGGTAGWTPVHACRTNPRGFTDTYPDPRADFRSGPNGDSRGDSSYLNEQEGFRDGFGSSCCGSRGNSQNASSNSRGNSQNASPNSCKGRIFGFHIHSGSRCSGNGSDPFADTDGHYNPGGCEHPYHAGDMPPLFGSDGCAYLVFLTNRFTVNEVIGRTVVIHDMPDDFTSQPAGNAGNKIACGVICRPSCR